MTSDRLRSREKKGVEGDASIFPIRNFVSHYMQAKATLLRVALLQANDALNTCP